MPAALLLAMSAGVAAETFSEVIVEGNIDNVGFTVLVAVNFRANR